MRAGALGLKLLLLSTSMAPLAAIAAPADLVKRGGYLVQAGDCAACHSAPGHPAYTGGDYLSTPFGRMAAPNITPDKETGIGTWSDDDFYRALHTGVRKDGAYLYPGMPYVWYTRVTRDDVLAIKAYLFSLPPVHAPVQPTHLMFPANIRAGIAGWNALYFKPGTFKPDQSKSPEWNRGAYLVEGLGHCAACHTPTNFALASISDQAYAGGKVDGWYAPNITSDVKEGIGGWSEATIVDFLKKGAAKGKGVVIGPMQAVHDSLAKLSDSDLHAIAIYLKTIPPKVSIKHAAGQTQADYKSGADIYLSNCAACHQPDGKGIAEAVPPLQGNGAVTAKGPENVVRAVAGGLHAQGSYGPMPGFATLLSPQQIADVTNYVRTSWGNAAPATADAGLAASLVKDTPTMIAATRGCEKPVDSPLGKAVSDPAGPVQAEMRQINDTTLLPQVEKIIREVRRAAPGAARADIVNQLTAAYCPLVFNDKSVVPEQRAPKLDRFAALAYTELTR